MVCQEMVSWIRGQKKATLVLVHENVFVQAPWPDNAVEAPVLFISRRVLSSMRAVIVPDWRRPLLFCGNLNSQPKTGRCCTESTLRCPKISCFRRKMPSYSSYHLHLCSPFVCSVWLTLSLVWCGRRMGICSNVHHLELPGMQSIFNHNLLFTHRPSPFSTNSCCHARSFR